MDLQAISSSTPSPTALEHLRIGGPAKVVVLADRLLLGAVRETLEAVEGVQVVGAFTSSNDFIDWLMWKRAEWQLAFVDFALRAGSPAEAVASLLAQPRPGEVVALGAARWPEMQQACAAMGIHRILDRGNVAQLRAFLQEWLQHGAPADSFSSRATPAAQPAEPAGYAATSP
jgi:DNA-binding NarL/FixJ family response regulator